MPRHSTIPTTFEDRRSFTIITLKQNGYLEPGVWKSGTLTWSRNGEPRGSIGISVSMHKTGPVLRLSYTLNRDKDIAYDITLITVPSNLGKGNTWYFLCPFTQKKCRKLYLADGYFMHREAIKGYYEKQIQSKQYRVLETTHGSYFQYERLLSDSYSKHFRKFYKGKPTKRYTKVLAAKLKSERINETRATFNHI